MIQQVYITVTPEDILNGERADSCKCPIARALRRAVPHSDGVEVCEHFFVFHDNGIRWFTSLLPLEAVRFMEEFDAGGNVAPFEFQITFFKQDSLRPALLKNIDLT